MIGALAYFLVGYAVFAGIVVFLMTFGRSTVFAGTLVERASIFIAGGCFDSGLELIKRVCGEGAARRVDSVLYYCLWEKNPILPVTYFVTVGACYFLYYYRVFSWFPTSVTPSWHNDPGMITKDNLSFWMSADPPGDPVYPNRQCYTCAWIANCVGALNFRYFLSFVLANIFMMAYGAILAVATMWGVLKDAGALDRPILESSGKRVMLRKDMRALLKFTMHHFTVLPAIAVFLAAAAIILTGFFGYNAWNISCGMTGNDRFKVSEYNREVALEKRDESYVTDSPKHAPERLKISYSKGFFRNWLEVLLPGMIQAKAVPPEDPQTACTPSDASQQPGSMHKED